MSLSTYCVAAGADVHAETQTGDTSLTYACENGHTDVAKVLLERGAKLVSHSLLCTRHCTSYKYRQWY